MNGEAQPPGYYKQSFLCEAFRILSTNYAMLSDTIDRSTHWEKNIDTLSSRLTRFTEQFESRCTAAIESSKSTIEQTAYYKLFDQDLDPSFLPTHFQHVYSQHRERVNSQKGAILIDIGTESEATRDEVNSHICDRLETLRVNSPHNEPSSPSSSKQLKEANETGSTDEMESKLPPPLAPVVISSNNSQP